MFGADLYVIEIGELSGPPEGCTPGRYFISVMCLHPLQEMLLVDHPCGFVDWKKSLRFMFVKLLELRVDFARRCRGTELLKKMFPEGRAHMKLPGDSLILLPTVS
jgi:hypothetical protein